MGRVLWNIHLTMEGPCGVVTHNGSCGVDTHSGRIPWRSHHPAQTVIAFHYCDAIPGNIRGTTVKFGLQFMITWFWIKVPKMSFWGACRKRSKNVLHLMAARKQRESRGRNPYPKMPSKGLSPVTCFFQLGSLTQNLPAPNSTTIWSPNLTHNL